MGCDIHIMVERKEYGGNSWINSGDPQLGRNYALFYTLAGVRGGVMYNISSPRGIPGHPNWDRTDPLSETFGDYKEEPCFEFQYYFDAYGTDAHSTSYFTLKELEVEWDNIDDDAKPSFERLLDYMRQVKKYHKLKKSQVRIVFFFDS